MRNPKILRDGGHEPGTGLTFRDGCYRMTAVPPSKAIGLEAWRNVRDKPIKVGPRPDLTRQSALPCRMFCRKLDQICPLDEGGTASRAKRARHRHDTSRTPSPLRIRPECSKRRY